MLHCLGYHTLHFLYRARPDDLEPLIPDLVHTPTQLGLQFLCYVPVYENPLGRHADLPRVEHRAKDNLARSARFVSKTQTRRTLLAASLMSAQGRTIAADLPPSSITDGLYVSSTCYTYVIPRVEAHLRCLPQAAASTRPSFVEPVKFNIYQSVRTPADTQKPTLISG